MEKELSCSNYGLMMEMSIEQLTNNYFQTNWENTNDQNDPTTTFESALSSMVSSPTTTPNKPTSSNGGILINELIGRLGSICDSSNEITINSNNNTSCYNTPINSPISSNFNLSSLMIMGNNNNYNNENFNDGFIERAAKFSCFGNSISNSNNSNVAINRLVPKLESGKISRVNSENNNGDSREGSSVSEQNPGVKLTCKPQNDGNSRKRKSISKGKTKDSSPSLSKDDKVEVVNEESSAKRSKVDNEENKKENERECNNSKEKEKNDKDNNDNCKKAEKPEPPKDYIHVRARRGQATDSHSLAERVRREKISERMKFLQDLVPGCNKVTGKATVLDEIINYVQSLQRQVEFLSMKLSTVNPRAEFNMEALLSKDMFQSRGSSLHQPMYPLDHNSAQDFPFVYQSTQQMPLSFPNGVPNGTENPFLVNPMNIAGIRPNPNVPLPSIDGFTDSLTQLPTLWEDDLQSIVQMGNVPNQTQSLQGTLPNAHMKVEL